MTEQKYRAVVRTADGRQMYGTLTGIQSAREEITATFTEDRAEGPVPTTAEPPVTDTSSGEHRRVIRHVGDDLPICDTCINVLGLNVRWDHAVLRHEREGITPAEAHPSPSLPTREQIAEAIYRGAHKWEDLAWQHKAAWYERADAVLALLQKGAA